MKQVFWDSLNAMQIQQGVSLASFTSWQVGGPAEFFCLPQTLEDLKQALQFSRERELPLQILGGGSNILIADRGLSGLTICLKQFSSVEVSERAERLVISAQAGASKADLLKIFLRYKLAPALFLAGLPGDVGGGVVMNAGVAESVVPREFVEIVDDIEVLRPDGSLVHFKKNQLRWEYRHCSGWQPGVIVKVNLSWEKKPDASILDQVKAANRARLSKQPLDFPSCGSVFVNPPGEKAARLIDSCGLKGYTVGGAQVSLKHANFIVNKGGATARDIWSVVQHVRSSVWKQTGVKLRTEVVLMGTREDFPENQY